jgi:hypothetical protein
VGFALCFALASLAVPVFALRALEAADVRYAPIRLGMVRNLRPPLLALAESRGQPDLERVALLGDSTVMSYPEGRRIVDRLLRAVNRETRDDPRVQVYQLTTEGQGPFDYYFIADVITSAHPDQALLAFNLSAFGIGTRKLFARPELAGFVGPARLGEAIGLPLHWIGLNTDELLFYNAVIGAGGYRPWRLLQREQVRVGRARAQVERWLGEWAGAHPEEEFRVALQKSEMRRILVPIGGGRYRQRPLRAHYAPALAGVDRDHPVLRVFGAMLSHLERSGIRTLVFTVPLNVEHIDLMGLFDEAGLARTLAAIEATVREAGGRFVDLHDLFPDQGFRDAAGHLTVEGAIDGPAEVAAALVPHVVAEAKRPRTAGN